MSRSLLFESQDIISPTEATDYQNIWEFSQKVFEVYRKKGIIQHNYMNIIVMILRLRLFCDHPLLAVESAEANKNEKKKRKLKKERQKKLKGDDGGEWLVSDTEHPMYYDDDSDDGMVFKKGRSCHIFIFSTPFHFCIESRREKVS